MSQPTSFARLVDCRILRCHAEASSEGGALSQWEGSAIEMIRGTLAECSAGFGGAAHLMAGARLALVDVLIARCRATDTDGGGGIYVGSGTLTMSGGAIRDCEATKGSGGALISVEDGVQVQLSDVTVQGCKSSAKWGAPLHVKAGRLSLVDVRIQECYGDSYAQALYVQSGALHAERVQVVRCGHHRGRSDHVIAVLQGISTWTDCIVADNYGLVWIPSGTHTFTRTALLRSRDPNNPQYGAIEISTGTLTMIDSRIADPGMGPWQVEFLLARHGTLASGIPGHPCVVADGKSTLILRNTTLSNCGSALIENAQLAYRSKTYLSMSAHASTRFEAELLTLEPSCDQDPSAALIGVESAFSAPLNVRGLRVVAPAACASQKFAVLNDHVRLVNCSDAGKLCGADATCTDVQPQPSVPDLTTANCSCQGDYFPNPNGTSLALAPYGFDPNAIGLPEGVEPISIGLPIIDYCVRAAYFSNLHKPTGPPALCKLIEPRIPAAGDAACGAHGQPQCPGTSSRRVPPLQDRSFQYCAYARAHDRHGWHQHLPWHMDCRRFLLTLLAVASTPRGQHRRDGAVRQLLAHG